MPASDDQSSLLSEFDPVPVERWRARVEEGGTSVAALQTRSIEGPTLEALYAEPPAGPGARPPARDPGWAIAVEYAPGDGAALARVLAQDVARGLEQAWVSLPDALRAGTEGSPGEAGVALGPQTLPSVLDALGPAAACVIDAGLAAPGLVRALLDDRGAEGPDHAVLCDPLATLAVTGGLGKSLDEAYGALAETTRQAASSRPSLRTILVDAVGLHDAGASAEQEVAFAIAAGIEHLRRLEAQGLSPAAAMPHLMLRIATGGELLVEVAKLRAVRHLWARVRTHAGAGSGPATPLWVRTSGRAITRRDPWVNLLRGSVGGLAAVLGGASTVAVQPFTDALGSPTVEGRRWAINTQHILRGECHLGVVDDPVAGSWAFEAVTDALARGAWALVQGWLARGGLAQALQDGVVQAEVAERAAARSQALATGRLVSVGTSLYPLLDEVMPPVGEAVSDELEAGSRAGSGSEAGSKHGPEAEPGSPPRVRAPVLARRRPTEPFEALRDRSDAITRTLGHRPRAVLVTVGDARRARAQVDFARNVVGVGGFEAVVVEAGASPPEATSVVILCAPAEALAEHGPVEARRWVAEGHRVLVAGRPTDPLRDAGVHDFVHRGRDVLTLLTALVADLFPRSEVSA